MDNPTWGYRLKDGVIEAKIFPDGNLPRGWKDTPAGMKANDNDD